MRRPWDIAADDIDRWAERVKAPALLPTLLRRLLSATVPLRALEMRAGAGPQLAGWDGVVVSTERGAFCPAGISVWEPSASAEIQRHFDADFERRTAAASPIVPGRTTYVAITARRFPGKGAWSDEKRALGVWADVRALDAEDLAAWLVQAPAVARWFAGQLGRAPGDAMDVEAFLSAWSGRTSPPLPFELVLAGQARQAAARAVRAWLTDPRPGQLRVRGETKEEAIVFVAAVLAGAPPVERERWLSRALVVTSRDALRRATDHREGEPLVILPDLREPEEASAPASTPRASDPGLGAPPARASDPGSAPAWAYLVAPHAEGDSGRVNVTLAAMPADEIAEVLLRSGTDEGQAHRLADESGGRISALQRLSGYVERPAWAGRSAREPLIAMLLAGAWDPANPADGEVVRRLGADPRALEDCCGALCSGADAAITGDRGRSGRTTWRWTSPAEVWRALARELTEDDLRRFSEVALDVLGQTDASYDLPKTARYFAAMERCEVERSVMLREGLAESLVRLAQCRAGTQALGGSRGARLAADVVRRLLPAQWKPWASLSDLLPVLAEAAPEAFLDALQDSLDRTDSGASHLFAEEGDFTSPHTGLLWALETLGWSKELMPRVADALARLAARDPGGRVANRPANSLSDLLHYAMPQTAAPVEDRLRVFEALLHDHPDVGWRLALGLLSRLHVDMMTPARRPKHLPWPLPPEQETVSDAEALEVLSGIVALLIRHADGDAARWAALIEPARHLPDHLEAAVLDALGAARAALPDPAGEIWAALRAALHIKHRAGGTEDLSHLERLYKAFAPADVVVRTAWLFSGRPALPERVAGGWRAMEARIDERRAEAVHALWRGPDPWGTLARLVQAVDAPSAGTHGSMRPPAGASNAPGPLTQEPGAGGSIAPLSAMGLGRASSRLGEALGKAPFAEELEARLLEGPREDAYAALTATFAATRLGTKGYAWLSDMLRGLVAAGRIEDAAGIVAALEPTKALWDVLDALGDPLRLEYWRRVRRVQADGPDQWERAIRTLLELGREAAAMEAASNAEENVSPATVLLVLERLVAAKPSEDMERITQEGMADVHVERLFDALERDPSIDVGRLARLSLSFLPRLNDSSRSVRHLLAAMEQSPEIFITLINMSYRQHGEPEARSGEDVEQRRRQAERAHEVLSAWTGYPGRGLPDDARERQIHAWAAEALQRTGEEGRGVAGTIEVAAMLARAPASKDGRWPCRAARELIEAGVFKQLGHHLQAAERNLHGTKSRPIGRAPRQERDLAATFHAAAAELRGAWPRTAEMLAELAGAYDQEAEDVDAEAWTVRGR